MESREQLFVAKGLWGSGIVGLQFVIRVKGGKTVYFNIK